MALVQTSKEMSIKQSNYHTGRERKFSTRAELNKSKTETGREKMFSTPAFVSNVCAFYCSSHKYFPREIQTVCHVVAICGKELCLPHPPTPHFTHKFLMLMVLLQNAARAVCSNYAPMMFQTFCLILFQKALWECCCNTDTLTLCKLSSSSNWHHHHHHHHIWLPWGPWGRWGVEPAAAS